MVFAYHFCPSEKQMPFRINRVFEFIVVDETRANTYCVHLRNCTEELFNRLVSCLSHILAEVIWMAIGFEQVLDL
jgi:hypothetical protein